MSSVRSTAAQVAVDDRQYRRPWSDRTVDEVLFELSRDLHDEVAQALNLLLLEMERFKLDQVGRASVLHEVEFLQAATRLALSNLRNIVFDLRDDGRPLDLRERIEALRARTLKMGISEVVVTIAPDWPGLLPLDVATHILRIVEEAVVNAVRHSECRSLSIELSAAPEYLLVSVGDDGNGLNESKGSAPTLGLKSMRERAALIGGDLTITSQPFRGTSVLLSVPLKRGSRGSN